MISHSAGLLYKGLDISAKFGQQKAECSALLKIEAPCTSSSDFDSYDVAGVSQQRSVGSVPKSNI